LRFVDAAGTTFPDAFDRTNRDVTAALRANRRIRRRQ
jgi:hypothetical protein